MEGKEERNLKRGKERKKENFFISLFLYLKSIPGNLLKISALSVKFQSCRLTYLNAEALALRDEVVVVYLSDRTSVK